MLYRIDQIPIACPATFEEIQYSDSTDMPYEKAL